MKLIKQSYEILEQEIPASKMDDYSGSHFREQYMANMYKHIERCGRTCYKSTDRITEDSAERFVNGLIKSKHLSVLEHGVIYLKISGESEPNEWGMCDHSWKLKGYYSKNSYSKVCYEHWEQKPNDTQQEFCKTIPRSTIHVTTNYRVIIENGWEEDLQYLCEPTEYHELRHTVLLHGCIHTYKDLTRHRKASFSIESTRYCNYSKTDKFGEMKFVLPSWVDNFPGNKYDPSIIDVAEIAEEMSKVDWIFLRQLVNAEHDYNELISLGWKPEQAAEILPQCTAADIVMTAFDSDWKFIFDLRSDIAATGKPHPLVEELMTPLRDDFKERKWVCK